MPRKHHVPGRGAFLATLLLLALGGCREATPPTAPATAGAATRPAQAVRQLVAHLHDNDWVAFARDAVPPTLHAQLQDAWREGRTRWPLDELPFDDRLPALLKSLAAPDSETSLQQVFDRQFSGKHAELKAAAAALGLFGAQYVDGEGNYSADERAHYTQLVAAMSRWGMTAPLGDPQRARKAIPQLAAAARGTGLARPADFAAAGMDDSLRRLAPFAATLKQVLAQQYRLPLDASLAGMQVALLQQTGDSARVRMRYQLGGSDIDTVVSLQRVDGRWYLADYLRHARAAVAAPEPAAAARAGR
jgi:hypothetical protein